MWSVNDPEYDDDYDTCEQTEATFRMFHETLEPSVISQQLGIDPTDSYRRGDVKWNRPRPFGAWFLSSEGIVVSKDVRRHLDWVIDKLKGNADLLHHLHAQGYRMDVYCKWVSSGQGGPTISPRNMQGLGALGLMLGIEVYWGGDEEERPLIPLSSEDPFQ